MLFRSVTSAGIVTFGTGNTLTTNGAQTYTGQVTGNGVTLISTLAGAAISATNTSNDFTGNLTITTTATGSANIVDTNALALGVISTGSLTAKTLAGDLTLNGAITAGGPVVLQASNNITISNPVSLSTSGAGFVAQAEIGRAHV